MPVCVFHVSDWCISRQLWWGHQIPAYRVTLSDSTDTQEVHCMFQAGFHTLTVTLLNELQSYFCIVNNVIYCVCYFPQELWVWGRSEEEARERAAGKYGVTADAFTLTQGDC